MHSYPLVSITNSITYSNKHNDKRNSRMQFVEGKAYHINLSCIIWIQNSSLLNMWDTIMQNKQTSTMMRHHFHFPLPIMSLRAFASIKIYLIQGMLESLHKFAPTSWRHSLSSANWTLLILPEEGFEHNQYLTLWGTNAWIISPPRQDRRRLASVRMVMPILVGVPSWGLRIYDWWLISSSLTITCGSDDVVEVMASLAAIRENFNSWLYE